jgi:transposase-like protein
MSELYIPSTLIEAVEYFANPNNAFEFAKAIRWPDVIACPDCGSVEHSFIGTRKLWRCKGCKSEFTIKRGTIFEDSALPIGKWLCAIWLFANAKNGISSWELHRSIGVTQKSAWFMLHRIRHALEVGTFEKLSGTVEVDETYIGSPNKNRHKDKRVDVRGGLGHKTPIMGFL